jgi:acetylglutamate kinase
VPGPFLPPSADLIADLAEEALAGIPAPLRERVRAVSILVEDSADEETAEALGLESPWDLTGLYRGVPFGQAEAADARHAPDMILLYREPILLEWIETGEDLRRLVRSVLIHEIAHHFGFSDAEIERLEEER